VRPHVDLAAKDARRQAHEPEGQDDRVEI